MSVSILFVVLAVIVAILLAGERVRGALLRWEQTQYAWALKLLALQRDALERTVEVPPEELVAAVNQVALDVLGEPAGIERLFDVRLDPPLTMTFSGGGRFYTFTPQPDKARRLHPRGRWFVVDGLTAHPFAVEELAAAFAAAAKLKKPGEAPVLPRCEQWGLAVWKGPKGREAG